MLATRLRLMMGVLVVSYGVLGVQLFHLTVIQGAKHRKSAEEYRIGNDDLPALRGPIVDRHGRLLAVDEPAFDLHVRVAELEGEGSIRRTARLLGLGRVGLRDAVHALLGEVANLTRGLEPAEAASVRARSYLLRGIEIDPDDGDLLELTVSPEDHSGFSVFEVPGEGHCLYVCPAELQGDAVLRRIEAVTRGEITVEALHAALDDKRDYIGKKVEHILGSRAVSSSRRQKVTSDVRGWALPVVRDIGDVLAHDALLHPERFVGFEVVPTVARRYPAGPVAPHLLGQVTRYEWLSEDKQDAVVGRASEIAPTRYLNRDFVGTFGLERKFEARLHGTPGLQTVERTRRGRGKMTLHRTPPVDGKPLWLTIDLDLQVAVEAALDRAGRPGAVVVLAPGTGEVLAMASSPRYDPGDLTKEWKALAKETPSSLLNRALRPHGQMPPGSVFKLVTALAGLEDGTLDPDSTVYDCHLGVRPRCENHVSTPGLIGFEEAMAKSCNVFFGGVALASGVGLDDWAERLGFGQNTGIELPEETYHSILERAMRKSLRSRGIRKQMGIGQILEASPLQVARMTCAFVNGGRLVDCHLDLHATGLRARSIGADPRSLAYVRRGMEMAVDAGTATASGVGAFGAAGKTGSSQAGTDKESGSTETHAWFTGYAPRQAPELVVTVFVDHIGHGGAHAAPVARDVLEAWDRLKRERGQ